MSMVPTPPRIHKIRSTSGSSHACSRSATRFSAGIEVYSAGSPSRAFGMTFTLTPAFSNRQIASSTFSPDVPGLAGATSATVLIHSGKIPARRLSAVQAAGDIAIPTHMTSFPIPLVFNGFLLKLQNGEQYRESRNPAPGRQLPIQSDTIAPIICAGRAEYGTDTSPD